MPRRRWRRSRGRRGSPSRPSTRPSRPRAACCGRSGTCSYAATSDDEPVMDRSWYREVLDEPDPERQLRLNARNSRIVKGRVAALLGRDPPGCSPRSRHPDALEPHPVRLLRQPARHRRELDGKQALRAGLDVDRATDILWTLNHPDMWQLLVGQRRWTPGRIRAVVRRHRLRAAAGELRSSN